MPRENPNHGSTRDAVLFRIAMNANCTARDLSDELLLSRPTVWSIIGELRRAGMVRVRKIGRRNYYAANPDAPFSHRADVGLRRISRWRD